MSREPEKSKQVNRRDKPNSIKSVFSDARLLGYNFLLCLLSPYILWRKFRRAHSRRTSHEFDWNRWTCIAQPEYSHATGAHIVLFCTGAGELRIASELTKLLRARNEQLNITWAIRRRDVAELARVQFPRQSIVSMPFDFFWPCCNWISVVKPDILVGIERLWWPNLFWHARLNHIRSIVVGATHLARIKVSFWDGISRWTLRALDLICLQSEAEREKLAPFLPPENVRVLGALKWFEETQNDGENNAALRAWLRNEARPLLLAGSTHEGEDEFVLRAFEAVRENSDCALLIAPRQLHRIEKIETLCRDAGWKVSRRSQAAVQAQTEYSGAEPDNKRDNEKPDVFLLDTMGELASAYQFARAAFVGGTVRGAGHNVLEPLAFGVPVSFGVGGEKAKPTTTQGELMEAGLGNRVATSDELASRWNEVLQNANWPHEMQSRLENFRLKQNAAWQNNVTAILELLPNNSAKNEDKN